MNLVVFHKQDIHSQSEGADLLSFLFKDSLLAHMIALASTRQEYYTQRGYRRLKKRNGEESIESLRRVCWAVPGKEDWEPKLNACIFTNSDTSLPFTDLKHAYDDPWFVISNGRYVDRINFDILEPLLRQETAQVIGLSFEGRLHGFREKVRLSRDRQVIGIQRYYEDSCVPIPLSQEWPHRVFIRRALIQNWETVPLSYQAFLKKCEASQAVVKEYRLGGNPIDLKQGCHVLRLFQESQNMIDTQVWKKAVGEAYTYVHDLQGSQFPQYRCYGHAWVGREVKIHPSATLLGPVIIGDRVSIGAQAVIDTAIIGPDVEIASRDYISDSIIIDRHQHIRVNSLSKGGQTLVIDTGERFKRWPARVYVRFFKRILDIVFAAMVLLLFLPVMAVIALAIKMNSSGPVFYRAKRQGLHGKEFDCLKFRTMKVGADQLQHKLRDINDVDGPQFKLKDDPRISTVGRFLRDTYLDEIPQFINVVMGQMSVVGPRPSPKSENTHSPRWRDARLSVRPGVTGLWQLLRTREPSRDFQEWIHYDIEYVRRMSMHLDIWICWKTGLLMLSKFIHQF